MAKVYLPGSNIRRGAIRKTRALPGAEDSQSPDPQHRLRTPQSRSFAIRWEWSFTNLTPRTIL
jgi:hypothetical protein